MSTAPIFILGANRSGTTLLRLMLNAHSHIAVPEEMLYYRSFYANVPIEDWRAPNLPENVYEDLARTFVGNAVQLHAELGSLPLLDCILEAPTRDLRHPYRVVMDAWAEIHGKARWGEKTPGNLFYLDVIYDMFPDAKFVYLSRDPRAGTASMQRADFFPVDVVFNALSRRKHFETAWRLLHNHVPAQQWTCLRYEDLVRAPRKTLISLCDFLSEEFEPGMLAYHRTASTYMKEDAATGFNAAATRPVSTKSVEAWRDQLSPQAIALVESICDGGPTSGRSGRTTGPGATGRSSTR